MSWCASRPGYRSRPAGLPDVLAVALVAASGALLAAYPVSLTAPRSRAARTLRVRPAGYPESAPRLFPSERANLIRQAEPHNRRADPPSWRAASASPGASDHVSPRSRGRSRLLPPGVGLALAFETGTRAGRAPPLRHS
jgi:hypothetical protein